MVDLSKEDDSSAQDHIELLSDALRETIDEMSEEHSSLSYREILTALELIKLEVVHEFFCVKTQEE